MKKLGLMGAMPEEMELIVASMKLHCTTVHGNRSYYEGEIQGIPVVAVFSRWGKVAAASTATTLIEHFGVEELLFTGVAGGIAPELSVGDVVISRQLYQHDMDARPLMARYEVPLTGRTGFETNSAMSHRLEKAVVSMLEQQKDFLNDLAATGIQSPKVVKGDVASGDQFIAGTSVKESIREGLPSVLCVEMEGAAVGQVCYDFGIPLALVRVISDTADELSHELAIQFVDRYAARYLQLIVHHYIHENHT